MKAVTLFKHVFFVRIARIGTALFLILSVATTPPHTCCHTAHTKKKEWGCTTAAALLWKNTTHLISRCCAHLCTCQTTFSVRKSKGKLISPFPWKKKLLLLAYYTVHIDDVVYSNPSLYLGSLITPSLHCKFFWLILCKFLSLTRQFITGLNRQ